MFFPKDIANIIVKYVGEWACEEIILNFDCKQLISILTSDNGDHILALYDNPQQIVLINKETKKKDVDEKIKLVRVLDTGNFYIQITDTKTCDNFLVEFDKNLSQISKNMIPCSNYEPIYYVDYLSANNKLYHLSDIKNALSFNIGLNGCACDTQHIVFRSHNNLILYSTKSLQEIAKLKFDDRSFPHIIHLTDEYLMTISSPFNELRIYHIASRRSLLHEILQIHTKITIFKTIHTNDGLTFIFGSEIGGLYYVNLNDIKNINNIPINVPIFNICVSGEKIYVISGLDSILHIYGKTRNVRLFREISKDFATGQFITTII